MVMLNSYIQNIKLYETFCNFSEYILSQLSVRLLDTEIALYAQ